MLRRAAIRGSAALRGASARRSVCYALDGVAPETGRAAFVAPSASLVGAIALAEDASVWHNCVLRGDVARISIGPRSNVQDGTVIHVGTSERNPKPSGAWRPDERASGPTPRR